MCQYLNIIDSVAVRSFSSDIANAVAYIHANHVIHLDLKPANVIITADDRCKVGDFGCCQLLEEDTGRVSPTNRSYLTGTFAYRAPELLRGDAPTPAADVYSFGVTLWQMAARRQPYAGENQHVVIYRVIADNLRPMAAAPAAPAESGTASAASTSATADALVDWKDSAESRYRDLYVRCWDGEPAVRPVARDLIDVFAVWLEHL